MYYLIHDRTTVYNIGYRIVWSVKYRKDALIGHISEDIIEKYIQDQKKK